MIHVEIKKTIYPLEFGLSQIRQFAMSKKIKSFKLFVKWIKDFDCESFEDIGDLAELYHLALKKGCNEKGVDCYIEVDDIIDLAFDNHLEYKRIEKELQKILNREETL